MIHREDLAIRCFEDYVARAGRKHADAHFELACFMSGVIRG